MGWNNEYPNIQLKTRVKLWSVRRRYEPSSDGRGNSALGLRSFDSHTAPSASNALRVMGRVWYCQALLCALALLPLGADELRTDSTHPRRGLSSNDRTQEPDDRRTGRVSHASECGQRHSCRMGGTARSS